MKTKILILLVIISLFITACGTEETTTAANSPFMGGTQGVTAIFEPFGVEEDGLFSIFDTETFPIEVTVVNKGEHNLESGDIVVKLLGPSEEEFSGIESYELQNLDTIEKISTLVPTGGEETISFTSDAHYEADVSTFIDREWFANIEYNYQTEVLIPEVCLKEDLTDDRICEVKETKDFFVSGAPIYATSVEESTAGKGIMALKIGVMKAGVGKVTKQGEDFGVRDTIAYTLDDEAWECKSGGKVNEARLIDGTAEIVCKLKEALQEDALSTKQVKLTLQYKYRDIIQEKIRIKESAE